MEALLGLSSSFDADLLRINNQPGQSQTGENLRSLLSGSGLIDSDPERVQDAYSLRCTPQVYGPIRDMWEFIRNRTSGAINAATDNPLIFIDPEDPAQGKAISGGNFHGEGPALWLDTLGIHAAEIGGISERRIFRLITPELNADLPAMLVQSPGLDSGLMMPQYTAAALVSQNKTLAHPDSVDSIPTSGNQEDHVSMGGNAALHTLQIIENVRHIIAIELLTASQAIDLRPQGAEKLGRGTSVAYQTIREHVAFLDHDRETSNDIKKLVELIRMEEIVNRVQGALGQSLL
jgi:histidine ammonia-lyase